MSHTLVRRPQRRPISAGGMTALALSLALAFSLAPQQVRAQDAAVNVSIAAQPLGDALLKLGQQTSLQVFFSPDLVAGLAARPVSGRLAPEEALRQLLTGTDIQYTRNGNNVRLSRPVAEATTLEPVTVSAGILGTLAEPYAGGQVATGGSLGLLGSTDVMDTPFSTVNYTSDLLYNEQARTLADVVVNDASVRMTTSTGGFSDDFQIRGFAVNSGDVSVNGLYGLVSSSRVPVQIMERVEVLKGPGTLMRGIPPEGSVGGAINIVTKRAEDEPLTRVTASYMSESNFTGQIDMGRRFGENNAWGVRFNGAKRGGEATVSGGDQQLDMGALGLDYRGERLRWSLDAIYQEYDTDSFRGQMGFLDADIPKAPKGDTNLFPGAKLTQRDQTIMSRLEYDFTDHITAHIGAGYRDGKNRQLLPWTAGADANGDFTIYNYYYDSYSKTFSGDTGLTATFQTGPVGHRVAFGVTRMAQENGNSFTTGGMGNSNIYDPAPLPALPAERLRPAKTDDTTLTSYALADTLSFMQDRVLLTLGARHQTVNVDSVSSEDYRSSAVSPVVGLVVKPLRNVSVYANFTKGLTSGGTVPLGYGYANEGDTLKPYKSKSAEAGVKVDWGSITTTAALFQIERPSAYANDDNLYGYFGEQRNRGLELNAFGEIVPSLRVLASATFINSELTKTQDGVNQGNRAQGVPSRAFSLGLDWDVPGVQGLAVNGRAIYTSAVYLDNAHEKRLPGVTRFDLGARYRTEIAGKEVVLRANVENVADKRYWLAAGQNGSNGYASYAAGRTYMLSASVNF